MPLGPISQPGASARLPDAPTSIAATAVSGGQASVSFTASTNPGKPSGNYVVTSSPGSLNVSGASSPITVTGLTAGTAYTFTVVKQSGSGISSVSSSASNSIGAFTTPTFGTQSGTFTAVTPSASSVSVSNVYNTTATLTRSVGANATFLDYERVTGSGGSSNSSSDSLVGLSENNTQEWRIRTTNTLSTFALTTSVNPQGSTTTVSVEFGDSSGYGSNAGSVNIGAGSVLVSSSFNLGNSSAATVFFRITATNAGGSVQTTGTILRTSLTTYNGSTTGSFTTYTSRSAISNTTGFSLSRPSYGANIQVSQVTLVGGGGGGGDLTVNGGGGGGGGRLISVGAFSFSGSISIVPGGPAAFQGDGFATVLYRDAGNVSAGGGKKGTNVGAGGNSGDNIHPGAAGVQFGYGGGGGGTGGGATNQDGGPGGAFGVGPGGPGSTNFGGGIISGSYAAGSSSASYGAGGIGAYGAGANGAWSIDWVGPAQS